MGVVRLVPRKAGGGSYVEPMSAGLPTVSGAGAVMGPRTLRPGKPEWMGGRAGRPSWGWGRAKTLMPLLWDSSGGVRHPEGSAQ